MRTLTLDGVNYSLPGGWNELTEMQMLALGAQLPRVRTPTELKVKLLLIYLQAHVFSVSMTGGKLYTLKIGKHNHKLTSEQVTDIAMDVMGWMTKRIRLPANSDQQPASNEHQSKSKLKMITPNPGGIANAAKRQSPEQNENKWEWAEQLHSELTKAPYPTLPCSCREVLASAKDGMADITWEQFGLLQTYHSMFKKDRTTYLDKMVAVLYRKSGTDFDAGKIDLYMEQAGKVSAARKEVILLWYYGVINFLTKKFPMVFSGGGTPPADVYKSHIESVNALAQGDITKFPDVMRANLYDVLYHLEAQIKERERAEKKMRAKSKK
jgi:hypothetical protein